MRVVQCRLCSMRAALFEPGIIPPPCSLSSCSPRSARSSASPDAQHGSCPIAPELQPWPPSCAPPEFGWPLWPSRLFSRFPWRPLGRFYPSRLVYNFFCSMIRIPLDIRSVAGEALRVYRAASAAERTELLPYCGRKPWPPSATRRPRTGERSRSSTRRRCSDGSRPVGRGLGLDGRAFAGCWSVVTTPSAVSGGAATRLKVSQEFRTPYGLAPRNVGERVHKRLVHTTVGHQRLSKTVHCGIKYAETHRKIFLRYRCCERAE